MAVTSFPAATFNRDRIRQMLNVLLANTQWLVVALGYVLGSNSNFDQRVSSDPPIIPAGYAFAIWGFIYPAALAYAIYQALPGQREHPLLRQIGWWTASAYLSMTCWILAAQQQQDWLTVVCIVWMLVSLVGAFRHIIEYRSALSRAERAFVSVPISVHTAWITIATVVNIATALWASGVRDSLMPVTWWACGMIVVAGIIGSWVTMVSRGNLAYGLTLIWALIGIIVANTVQSSANLSVALVAGLMALVVAGVLVRHRFQARYARV